MEGTFTPGPWLPDAELTPRDPGARSLQCRFFFGPNGLAIFRMGLGYENAATDEANARLIAASPTMLSALERIAAATPESTNSATIAQFQSWVRAVAETAIADAKASSPLPTDGGE